MGFFFFWHKFSIWRSSSTKISVNCHVSHFLQFSWDCSRALKRAIISPPCLHVPSLMASSESSHTWRGGKYYSHRARRGPLPQILSPMWGKLCLILAEMMDGPWPGLYPGLPNNDCKFCQSGAYKGQTDKAVCALPASVWWWQAYTVMCFPQSSTFCTDGTTELIYRSKITWFVILQEQRLPAF